MACMGHTPGTIGRRPRRKHARGGFSLIELLVAMVIFLTVMSGVTFLFSGAIRASKQGFQNQDAFEVARGAMDILERDLSRSFTSRDHGDVYNFYGTPIGFTFVGMVTADESSNPNLARVTYVIHQSAASQLLEAVPFDDDDDIRRETFALLRFIEPGGEDLESFPVDWDNIGGGWALVDLPPGFNTLQDLIGDPADPSSIPGSAVYSAIVPDGLCDRYDVPCLQEIEKAKKRELWIRMLSGETGLPNIWSLMGPDLDEDGWPDGLDPEDFVVAENILNVDSAGEPLVDAFPLIDLDHVAYFGDGFVNAVGGVVPPSVFFTYRDFGTRNRKDAYGNLIPVLDPSTGLQLYLDPPTNSIPIWETEVAPIDFFFWNDRRNTQLVAEILRLSPPDETIELNLGSPLDARAPIEITVKFTLFFQSPYVGAPDFNREFTMRIDLPTGYRRLDLPRRTFPSPAP